MAGALKPVSQFDYSGGANPVASPALIGPKQSQRIHNMLLDEHGRLRTVDGTHILTTAPVSEAGSRILLPIYWQPASGSPQSLVITNPPAGPGGNNLYNRATNPWTLIGPFSSNTHWPSNSILNDFMLFTDGYSSPKYLNPSSGFGTISTVIGGQHTIQHEGFAYLFNTAASPIGDDGPSVLRQSDLNDPNVWNVAQEVFVAKDDGQVGMGMAVFTIAEAGIAPTDTLVLFKNTSTYQMTGNLGTGGGAPSSNFSLQQAKTDMGCYASKSIQFCAGFGIVRLTHRGFALFDGVDDRLISEEVRPYLFGRDDIVSIDWTKIDYSWASQSPNPPLYICFCPTATDYNLTRAFIYDLVRRAWTIIDIPFGIASITFITQPSTLPVVLLGDSPLPGILGNIRRWFSNDPDWDGVAITQIKRSRLAFDGSPQQRAYYRRMQMSIIADTSPVTVTTAVTCNDGTIKASVFTLGSSAFESQLETTIDHTCNTVYSDVIIVGRVRITGEEFHLRKKPLIGSNTLVRPTT